MAPFLLAKVTAFLLLTWILPVCNEDLVIFYGKITPHRQPHYGKGITWNVKVAKCTGCYQHEFAANPSILLPNGIFSLRLMPDPRETRITELELTISSMAHIPLKIGEKDEDRHRTFTWKLKHPDFTRIHHFQFGHFVPSKDHGLFLAVQFQKAFPIKIADGPADVEERQRKRFVKYYISVKRLIENPIFKKVWNEQVIYEDRELAEEEISAAVGGPILRLELVKPKKDQQQAIQRVVTRQQSKLLSKSSSDSLEMRLLKRRRMNIYVKQVPLCGYDNCKVKGQHSVYKLHKCNDYFHRDCINDHIGKMQNPRMPSKRHEGGEGGGGEQQSKQQYKCPICGAPMDVKYGKGGKEKDQAIFDEEKIESKDEFILAKLKMPILQNGDEPKYFYKLDYTKREVDNYHNEVDSSEAVTSEFRQQLAEEILPPIKEKQGKQTMPLSSHAEMEKKGEVLSAKKSSEKKKRGGEGEEKFKKKKSENVEKIVEEVAPEAPRDFVDLIKRSSIINSVQNMKAEEKKAQRGKHLNEWLEKGGNRLTLDDLFSHIAQVPEEAGHQWIKKAVIKAWKEGQQLRGPMDDGEIAQMLAKIENATVLSKEEKRELREAIIIKAKQVPVGLETHWDVANFSEVLQHHMDGELVEERGAIFDSWMEKVKTMNLEEIIEQIGQINLSGMEGGEVVKSGVMKTWGANLKHVSTMFAEMDKKIDGSTVLTEKDKEEMKKVLRSGIKLKQQVEEDAAHGEGRGGGGGEKDEEKKKGGGGRRMERNVHAAGVGKDGVEKEGEEGKKKKATEDGKGEEGKKMTLGNLIEEIRKIDASQFHHEHLDRNEVKKRDLIKRWLDENITLYMNVEGMMKEVEESRLSKEEQDGLKSAIMLRRLPSKERERYEEMQQQTYNSPFSEDRFMMPSADDDVKEGKKREEEEEHGDAEKKEPGIMDWLFSRIGGGH